MFIDLTIGVLCIDAFLGKGCFSFSATVVLAVLAMASDPVLRHNEGGKSEDQPP